MTCHPDLDKTADGWRGRCVCGWTGYGLGSYWEAVEAHTRYRGALDDLGGDAA